MQTSTANPGMRTPEMVMRLSRLGSMHQCRLSFMRVLPRRMAREGWVFARPVFDVDARGVGHAVYTATGPDRSYSLVAFGHDLPPDQRSDRVIATAWDATFTLFDGIPTAGDIARLAANIPYQEAGRVSASELSVSRANRSVRLWEHVVDALSQGHQPDRQQIDAVGYLMRTTAVYGSGKLGAADYETIAGRREMAVPFQAEMLSVWLTRTFVRDLVGHMARVRALPVVSEVEAAQFRALLVRSVLSLANWGSQHRVQIAELTALRRDMAVLGDHVAKVAGDVPDDVLGRVLGGDHPWDRLITWSQSALGEDGQELVASLTLEPYGALVDDLAQGMADPDHAAFAIDGAMPVNRVRALIEGCFGWALHLDREALKNCARTWYVSQEKQEPRLGERFEEPVAAYTWGMAEEAGKATRWLCARGIDGVQVLAGLLWRTDGAALAAMTPVALGPVLCAGAGDMCALMAGAALADSARGWADDGLHLENVLMPALILPFAAIAAVQLGTPVSVGWDGAEVACTDGAQLSLSGAGALSAPRAARVSLRCGAAIGARVALLSRAMPAASDWGVLTGLAGRTYAPATEDSRRKGAGAELRDDD